MPAVVLSSSVIFSENAAAQIVDPDIAISGGGTYTEGYIEFSATNSTSGDNFFLTSAQDPNAAGAISVEDGDVYLGNGTGRDRIGSVDETYNGQDGQPLRILFSSPLPNAGFEEGAANWSIRDEEYGDNGSELNLDTLRVTLATDSVYRSGTGTVNIQDPSGMAWDGSVQGGQGIDGSQALYLGSNGNIVRGDQNPGGSFQPDGYGSIHGPYATSSVISVQAGDSITLDFRAVGSGDDYEVFGFLRRVDADGNFISNNVNDTTDNILLFAQRGRDTGGWVSISEDSLPAGNYRFEFVGGTYDGSGGLYVGSNLYVDNIRLISATTVGDTVAQTIARQVTYQNDAEDAPLDRQITVTAVDSNGTSGTSSTGLTFVPENDSPSLADTALSPINEDTLPVGETVASIFTPVFSDPDNGFTPTDSLAGVVISGNAATADQGEWQYSTNGTDWYVIGSVRASDGLVLSDSSLIRFVPAADWNGTPGSLTAHAVDSTYEGDFTQDDVRTVFDTSSDNATSPVSANGASASITVISVNDAPVFTSVTQQLSVADSEANDTPAALTGTIAASDLHDGAPGENSVITYGIIDGTAADGIATRTDAYGTLSLDQASGTYSFLPDAEALNALAQGQEVVRSFTVTASDGQGGLTQQTLTVTLTGANDAPVAQGHSGTAIEAAGTNNNAAGSPASGNVLGGETGDFDPDAGDSVSLAGVRTGELSGSGAEGAWDQDVVTLPGTYGTLTMQADGSWTYVPDETNAAVDGLAGPSDTLSEVFTYTIVDALGLTSSAELTVTIEGRNDALNVSASFEPEIAAPEDTDSSIDLSGLIFEDPDQGSDLYEIAVSAENGTVWTEDFPGLTISGNGTGELVLTGSATDLGQWIAANDLAYRSPIDGAAGSDTVTLAYATAGETTRAPLGSVDVTITQTNDPAVIDTNGSSLVRGNETTAESTVITFLPTANAQILTFDGVSLVINPASTAEEIAEAFAAQGRPNWIAVHEGDGRVVLTATGPGNRPDLTADDFTDADGNVSNLVATTGAFDGQARFTARGGAVEILSNLELSDADSDTMSGATISMVEGLLDNRFGVLHESLSLTGDAQALAAANGINVTITTSATTGSSVVLTGEASAEVYETILQGVLYNNTNPNAVAGSRQVQVEVTDAEGQVSNLGAVALTEGNDAIAVGQRIYIDGEDSGQVVASVRDARSFVASGPLAGLDEGATLSFRDASGLVTTAISANDGRASVAVDVIWAPVIDMNGPQQDGDIHRVSYLEQQAPVAIATADARVEDQEGLIRTLNVELTNPLDNIAGQAPEEYLGARKAVLDLLAARGITLGDHDGTIDASGNLTGATRISFEAPAGSTATNFQIALRGVTYANMDDAPTAATRIVTAQATDMSGNVGLLTHTEINPQAVNDAPVGIDSSVFGSEDEGHVFSVADFGFSDPLDGGANQLASVTITSLPVDGQLLLNGQAITVGTVVSRADLEGGALVYAPSADANGLDLARFGFRVTDNGGTANGGRNTDTTDRTMVINVDPVNDAPVLVPGISTGDILTEDDIDNSGHLVSDLLGSVSDVDGSVTPGMAVYGIASEGPGGGQWQYRLDGGTWTDITLSEGEVLLLGADDAVRFVPDQQNATEAQLSYHAWDGTAGIAGTVVPGIAGSGNAANRGGSSAFSMDSADVSIEVTAVNDIPSIEVGQGNTFYARGAAVALFGAEELVLTDPDEGAALTQAVVTLDPETTTDNVFGTLYETIFSTGGASFTTSGGTQLTITGSGLADDPIVISGTGSLEDYREALQSLRYENANPNLFTGERSISLRITDETGAISQETSFELAVEWATVADLNGPSNEGRDHMTTYVEGSVGVAIATADAELIDEEGNTVEVVVTLQDGVNGTEERLVVDPAMLNALAALNISVLGNGTHEIRLQNLEGLDQTYFQLALRAIRYVNDSSAPTDAARHVTVTSTDSEGNPGVAATTTIGIEQVNDAPVSTLAISHPGSGTRTPFVGETLTLTGTVADADGFPGLANAQVEWLRNGTVIATGAEYVLSAADTGQAVSARLVYTDGEGNAELIDIATPGIAGLHLVGGSADDSFSGSIANDSLEGGAGRDTLAGGVGNDTLVGGADADTASYQSATSGVTVDLNLQGVAQLVGASEGSDTLISIENLIGSRFEDLLTGDAAANILSGGAGNDTILGEAGNDTLFGNQGDDLLEGGSGNDWMHGGQDSDQLYGREGRDTLGGGLGDDTLDGGIDLDTATYETATSGVVVDLNSQGVAQLISASEGRDTLISIENLIGSNLGDLLTGDAGANVLDGAAGNDTISGGAGADLILGGAGRDTLGGGLGDDTLNGGIDIDTATYETATSGVTVNLKNQGVAQLISASEGRDTLISIENLIGSNFGDLLTGDAGANAIDGGAGNDTISAGAGADLVLGGEGNDSLLGNQGDDVLEGGNGDDWMHGGQDSDQLYGGAGRDTLGGGFGDDTLDGGIDIDTATYETAISGVSVDLNNQSVAQLVSASEGRDTLISIENLTGSNFADLLTGNAGANVLNGAAGNDTISAGAGADRVLGGTSNDSLLGNQGDDTLEGGDGNDWLHGGQGNDQLYGGAGRDTLAGGVGDDALEGGTGADVFVFETILNAGIDTIVDYEQEVDLIGIGGQLSTMIQAAGVELADVLVWEGEAGDLSVDLGALGQQGLVRIATFANAENLNLSADDFLFV